SWRAARLPFAGGELAMAVVVPGDGHTVTDVEQALAGDGLHALLTGFETIDLVDVRLPSWTTRTSVELTPQLGAMGMRTAFTDDADFTAMTDDEPLKVGAVVHQAWIAVDEDGAEAAAATAVVMMRAGAAPAQEPRVEQVHADRPYVYVIHDVATATPLFVGRIDDPSA
ncbi:MAG: proteinase inhibitor serpin, partial [Nocardioidaceae bacterium]|nr:proteinase inhibitor serpin [Nocardioidaceae bacterium]